MAVKSIVKSEILYTDCLVSGRVCRRRRWSDF